MRALVPAAAVLVGGFALYFTNSVLDQLVAGGQAVRVALVPDWKPWAAFCGVAALALLLLSRRRPHWVTLPVFAGVLLIVPFLPLLPDLIPALQLPAGPLKWIVWLTTGGLLTWTLWHTRPTRALWLKKLSLTHTTLAIAALTAAAGGLAAWRLAGTVVFPGGDEPHYLVVAQSLWRDGDLKIENNHTRGDYREYFVRDALKPDFLRRGVNGEIYSIHPVGMPVLMAPVYALGGYWAVVAALILSAAAAAALVWRFVAQATSAPGAATFAWAAIALTAPFLYNTFTVYPEILAALAVVVAYTRAAGGDEWPRGTVRWAIVGACCGALPWLSTKYAPMSAVLVAIALTRARVARAVVVAVLAPYLVFLAAWLYFFYAIWGIPLPMAPYGDLVQTSPRNLIFGAPGLLFDQEYGVLAYAPVYVLAITGLVAMWRAGSEMRRSAIEIVLIFGALLGTVGAFRIWWGGTASPGRPLASGLLLLALPIAMASRRTARGSAARAGHQLLLLVSIGVAITLAVAQQGLLINNGRDGTSALLEFWSPRWEAWSVAPTFIFHEAPTAWLHALTWLAIAFAAAAALSRWRTQSAGGASLAALTAFVGALMVAIAVVPWLPHDPPLPSAHLTARSHLPLIDEFDSVARPIAVYYDPFRVEGASTVTSQASLVIAPGLHSSPQPIRVLHNGRLSLPAGRYRADVEWAETIRGPVPIALQVGWVGPSWQSWPVPPERGARWQTEFELPVDMNFVAFRGSTDLERAIGRLTIIPLMIVDRSARPNVPTVLGAWRYGPVTLLVHDASASPEPAGFWVIGRRDARVTFVGDSDRPLMLRMHSGLRPNRLRIATSDWKQTLDLEPGKRVELTLPSADRRVIAVDFYVEDGFTPRDHDPGSQDTRFLGVWVEVVQEDR
jgi:hypothetical protein